MIGKAIKTKDSEPYIKWKGYDLPLDCWIDSKDILK